MPLPEAERLALERSPEPGWIESRHGPLFSFYHPPQGLVRDCAVLLCETLGSDRMNLHLSYRHLGLRLAHAGFPVLRVDYPGTGDSSGSPRDPDRLEAWTDALDVAASALLAKSGSQRLALFGARFGGTLAAQLASQRDDVEDLVLWGPYVDGRAFLRSERALDRLSNANQAGRRPTHARPGDVEYLGFVYSAETSDAIRALTLADLRPRACRRARLFAWDDHSRESELAATLMKAGIEVELSRDPDLDSERSLTSQAIPEPLLDDTVRWLSNAHPRRSEDAAPPTSSEPWPRSTRVTLALDEGPALLEEAIFFGSDRDLFGLLTRPTIAPASTSHPVLILVNGGNNHRAGINRSYTEWARAAAAAGYPALRIDVRGLGDSPPLEASTLNVLYRTETIGDVLAAVDWMTDRFPGQPIVVAGLCAGAFQTFHAALRDPRIRSVLLLDLLRWNLEAPSGRQRGFLHRRKRQLERAWERVRAMLPRSFSGTDGSRSNELADGVLELVERGTSVSFVTALSGQGHAQLVDALAPRIPEIEATGRFRLESLSDTNHIFSPVWSQEWLRRLLIETVAGFSGAGTDARTGAERETGTEGSETRGTVRREERR